jgi:hypothetical protein
MVTGSVVKPIFVLVTTVFICYAQSGIHQRQLVGQSSKQTSASFQLHAGPLELDVCISETAQLFHVIDQISQWSEFSHPQYVRYFESRGGGLTESDRKILTEHAAIRKRYGWGHGPEQVFYTLLDLDEALKAGVASGRLTNSEAATERMVLTYFRSRVDQMVLECRPLDEFVSELVRRQSDLAAFAKQAQQFVGSSPANPIPFYVIADPDDTNMGGGYNGGVLTLEIPRKRDVYPTVVHELFHAFVQTKRDKVENAARSGAGLDFQTLNEGLAYAVSPGLQNTGGTDELQTRVKAYMARGTPLSDAFMRFNSFGLALRPLLKEALVDTHQNLESFLPRAVDAWLVLVELDRARKPQ